MGKHKYSLGIELGSTRIKAVIVDSNGNTVTSGIHDWENDLIDGFWTYDLKNVWSGIKLSIKDIDKKELLTSINAIGISAMMHGYLPFDKKDNLLVNFRTWRNANTDKATKELSKKLQFNIPHRWSIAHIYQAILDNEKHVNDINYFTTLAGYVHWKLTGEKVIGIGDASGMFPINSNTLKYDEKKLEKTNSLLKEKHFAKNLKELLPKPLVAGEGAGRLTKEGARLLDPEGNIKSGILMAPPEGDAGTGMVATNSVKKNTGNVSVGTSVFAMIVLDKELNNFYPEIDMVTTPDGKAVAMVHVNNCTSDLNEWINLFSELFSEFDFKVSKDRIFEKTFNLALKADNKNSGLLSYGYFSGENITGIEEGRPLFVRLPNSKFDLANFMASHLNSAFATLSIGMNILYRENVNIKMINAHGGVFKTEKVAQKFLAASIDAPIAVSKTASEGGAWGMAILANYANNNYNMNLSEYLEMHVFKDREVSIYTPNKKEVEDYKEYLKKYKNGLEIEKTAGKVFS